MKQNILFYFGCVMAISTVINALNGTLFVNNDFLIDSDNEHFYTVNILLEANGALTSKINQNDTGLSIRLTTRDGIKSEWYHLYINEESNYFGQYSFNLPLTKHHLGIISNITIRIDKLELATSTMPYYLCIHGTTTNNNNNNSTINENWNGCAYIQPSIGNKNGANQEYLLRDANGKLI
ncbi:unnamed protein product [Rotaria sordida]|uniref:Uncharacterized protein n=1 Tax=Rotaria sordida TaxID=392033 RepID=A0A814L8K7_9BILA|nr:unnamed protein product [Rotaria sordida]CAF3848227.1 unnamed protein product [Rotaria sordida]